MRDYKLHTYQRRQPADPILVAFVAICLGYIVAGMVWSQVATYFGW